MKKNLLKLMSLALVATMLATMLVACGGAASSSAAPGTTAPAASTPASATPAEADKPASLNLLYSYWDFLPDQEGIFADFAKQYKEKTGIDVKVEGQLVTDANWQDTLKTQIAAGGGSDIFHMDVNWLSAWADTVIQPLDSFYDAAFWDQFVPNGAGVWVKDGKHYGVSNSYSVISILYNEKMLADAGVTPPAPNATWTLEEFETALEKVNTYHQGKTIKYTDGKDYPYYTIGTTSAMYYFWLLFGPMGGIPMAETNNIAQNAYADGIVKMGEWIDKGWVTPSAEVEPGQATVAFSACGNVAFSLTGDWTPTGFYRQHNGIGVEKAPLAVSYASCPTPVGKDGKVVSEIYNQGVVMNKNLTGWKADAAAELIEYMTTSDAWLRARGPEVGGLGLPARKEWSELYATTWFEKPQEREAFIWTANNGRILSPDYQAGGIDLATKLTEVIKAVTVEAQKPGTMDLAAAKAMVVSKLEEQQKLLNLELQENEIELDNPDGKIK